MKEFQHLAAPVALAKAPLWESLTLMNDYLKMQDRPSTGNPDYHEKAITSLRETMNKFVAVTFTGICCPCPILKLPDKKIVLLFHLVF